MSDHVGLRYLTRHREWIALSYMDRLMMDRLSPTFRSCFCLNNVKIVTFYSLDLHISVFTNVFIGYDNAIDWKTRLEHKLS